MFCKYCGKELNDQAVICPACGCLAEKEEPVQAENTALACVEPTPVAPLTAEEIAKKEAEEKQKCIESRTKKTGLFSVLAFSFLCATAFALCGQLSDLLHYIIGASYYYDSAGFAFAVIFSLVALGMSITAFVLSRKIKKERPGVAIISTFVFIASIFAFFICILFS